MATSNLNSAIRGLRFGVVAVAVLSSIVNILYLTGSFFMMQVYDRVLPAKSLPTLVALLALALALYSFQSILDLVRSRILARFGLALDQAFAPRLYDLIARAPLKGLATSDRTHPLRDLDSVRSFLSGPGPIVIFDLPWMPLYLGICSLFHPYIGLAAVTGSVILVIFTWGTDRMTARSAMATMKYGVARTGLADAASRNAEVLAAMGMQRNHEMRWSETNRAFMREQLRTADVVNGFGAFAKAFRASLQSIVLALGAYLVIENQATAGVIIAASILTARAMAPAELAIANWKSFIQARQAWSRLNELCLRLPPVSVPLELPNPCKSVTIDAVSVAPPGLPRLVVQDVSLHLTAGQGLGIIGASASGKSSLTRALVGVWPCARGRVKIDSAALDQWTSQTLGPYIGYLPQEVELFSGSVAQNISRFESDAEDSSIVQAAQDAGVHELILSLPKGYETIVGDSGLGLSAGQRQRIGLARALYGKPFLVVLDEPNSNLDGEGEAALTQALLGVRSRGGICVVVAHRPSALAAVDHVLIMANGTARAFGPKDEVLKRAIQPVSAPRQPEPARPRDVPSPADAALQQWAAQ